MGWGKEGGTGTEDEGLNWQSELQTDYRQMEFHGNKKEFHLQYELRIFFK